MKLKSPQVALEDKDKPPAPDMAQGSYKDEVMPVDVTTSTIPEDNVGTAGAVKIEYARGMKLFLILTSLLVTFFTVLLDTVCAGQLFFSRGSLLVACR